MYEEQDDLVEDNTQDEGKARSQKYMTRMASVLQRPPLDGHHKTMTGMPAKEIQLASESAYQSFPLKLLIKCVSPASIPYNTNAVNDTLDL